MAYKTLDMYRRLPIATRRNSLTEVLLQDGKFATDLTETCLPRMMVGVVYFAVIFGANLVKVIMYLVSNIYQNWIIVYLVDANHHFAQSVTVSEHRGVPDNECTLTVLSVA